MIHLPNQRARGSAAVTLIGGIVILLATLYFLVKLATSGYYSDVDATTESATATRIMPTGNVVMGDGTPVGMRTGEQIFKKVCIQCHAADSTVANSPKITHNAEWAPRIAQGFDTLFNHALNGFNAMPAKGGATDLTDDELKRAIAYMANQSGGNLEAPPVAASGEAASGTAASGAAASGAAASGGATDVAANDEGKKVFEGLCMACHSATSAIPYAPRITKNDEWAPKIATGKAVLLKHAMEGFTGPDGGVMPAKGGNPDLTEAQISAAINYMANQSGGNFK